MIFLPFSEIPWKFDWSITEADNKTLSQHVPRKNEEKNSDNFLNLKSITWKHDKIVWG